MTAEEAIYRINLMEADARRSSGLFISLAGRHIELEMANEALEKQIPKKPVIKYHKEGKTPVKYGRLMELHCPNCNKLIVAMYETDRERGGGLHTDVKGCHKCLQAVDFAEYYYIGNLGEEIELE